MKITESQRLQLLGLLTLAHMHHKATKGIEEALRSITKEEDDNGHCQDAAWGNQEAGDGLRELLHNLKIEVEP